MKNIIRWFILNTVAANLLMIFIIIAGLFTLSRLRMEVFPDITIPIINVSVLYPGASPEDIEDLEEKKKQRGEIMSKASYKARDNLTWELLQSFLGSKRSKTPEALEQPQRLKKDACPGHRERPCLLIPRPEPVVAVAACIAVVASFVSGCCDSIRVSKVSAAGFRTPLGKL